MPKPSFKNDYSEGAHEAIINALAQNNLSQEDTYGADTFCQQASDAIKKNLGTQNADIHFVSGGTQANLLVISSMLKPYESVIAVQSGHIAVHEAGAIEATGHKINTVEGQDGKLQPQDIQSVLDAHTDEHMVKPKLVFISNSTEIGSVYSKAELTTLSKYCRDHNLYLYLDGARLASALTSPVCDFTMADIAALVDIFYIGGTKNGLLLGEAIVILHDDLKENFRYHLKQKGALLAKGRVLGVQFLELFRDNLFYELGTHANAMAQKIADAFKAKGYDFLTDPVSNQIFPILPNVTITHLAEKYEFYVWQPISETHSAIRLVTSWATKSTMVDEFIHSIPLTTSL